MWITQLIEPLIGLPTVRMHTTALDNGTLDEPMEVLCGAVGNSSHTDASNAVPVFLGRDHHQRLARNTPSFPSQHYSTHLGFVHFDSTAEFIPAGSHHGPAQLVQNRPSCLIAAQAQDALQPKCAGPILLTGHVPERPAPQPQGQTAILENSTGRYRCLVTTGGAYQPSSLRRPSFSPSTPWAHESLWPAQGRQVSTALLVGGKLLFQFQKRRRIVLNHPFLLQLVVGGVNRIALQTKSNQQGYPIDSTSLYLWCFWVVGAANEHLIRNRRHLHCLL